LPEGVRGDALPEADDLGALADDEPDKVERLRT
jgi:hypothetical protein